MQSATISRDPTYNSVSTSHNWAARLREWYVVATVGLFNAVLLLVVLNLVLYGIMLLKRPAEVPVQEGHFDADRLQQAYPGWREEDVKTLLREMPRADREFEYESLTGFRERPYRGKYVNIDTAGFRFSRNQAPWPPRPGVTNVFVFGGSTTFGYYLPDDETIPSYLQEYLTARAGPTVAVYNFARPGYFSSQELVLFQKLLRAGYVPQVAIFIDGLNDFIFSDGDPKFTTELRSFMDGQVNLNPLNRLPMIRAAHSLANRWRRADSVPQSAPPPDYSDPVSARTVAERWLANKKMIELTGAGYGVRTLFIWQPIPMYDYDLRYHLFLHSEKGFGGFMRAKYGYSVMDNLYAQGRLGSDLLWLADMQREKHQNLYVDSVHYTAAFSSEIAEQIANFLYHEPSDEKRAASDPAQP